MAGRVIAKLLLGGMAGWGMSRAYSEYERNSKYSHLPLHHIQEELARNFSNDYELKPWEKNWDKRDASAVEGLVDKNNNPVKTKAARHIILVRHGQYNAKGEQDEDRVLTDLGIEQATQTGKRLSAMDLPFSRMVVSTMTRARQTADVIQKELPAGINRVPSDLLREGAPFPPEPAVRCWRPEATQYLKDGPRIEEAFRTLVYRADAGQESDTYELVVCHANVIRYIVCRALQLPPESWARISLKHASITWLCIRPSGNVSVRLLGDSGFMPPRMLTS